MEAQVKASIINAAAEMTVELSRSSDLKPDLDKMVKIFEQAYEKICSALGIVEYK